DRDGLAALQDRMVPEQRRQLRGRESGGGAKRSGGEEWAGDAHDPPEEARHAAAVQGVFLEAGPPEARNACTSAAILGPNPATSAISPTPADRRRSMLPKCPRRAARRTGPMPARSSSTDSRIRLDRRSALKVFANRCASSLSRWS